MPPLTPGAATGRLACRPGAVPVGPEPMPPGTVPLPPDGQTLLLVPPYRDGPSPLLVFFHGAGGHAARSLPVLRETADRTGLLVLLPTSAGSTWDLLTGGLGPDVAALDAALAQVADRCAVERVAFAGFSDGASYALSLGLANGDLVEAVLAFSPGFVAPPAQVGRPRVWVSHGTSDAVLPVDRCGRRVVRTLGEAGYAVRYEEFDGGHVVTPELVSTAVCWWEEDP